MNHRATVEQARNTYHGAAHNLEAAVTAAVMAGEEITDVAKWAGVSRPTVYNWMAGRHHVDGTRGQVTNPNEDRRLKKNR